VVGWVSLLSEYGQEAPFAIDTLLAFALILRRYLPGGDHQIAVLFGTVTTLVARVVFIGVVSGLLATATWLLYLVGLLLVYTAVGFARRDHHDQVADGGEPERWLTRVVAGWGRRPRRNGLAYLPPMVLAVVLLTLEDPLVWPDGGPPYQTVLANVFALLPIPVLIGRSEKLLSLISYLPSGLGVVAGFLGVKIILFALHDNILPFVNGGEAVAAAPAIPPALSLVVTTGVVAVMAAASLLGGHGRGLTGHNTAALPADRTEDRQPPPVADGVPQPAAMTVTPHRGATATSSAPPGRVNTGAAMAVTMAVGAGLAVFIGLLAYRGWLAAAARPGCRRGRPG
jgi:tellurite resistance protein TerC